ncbi:MAG: glycine--tRNA ligase [bacterium]|nr:glycine--tRNA ligase [bacterium]
MSEKKLTLDTISSLAKRRGFIFQSSEIYGGLASCWDFGPIGVELKNNVKNLWWKHVVRMRDDVVGMDSSILMHPDVWVASGHVGAFHDMLVDCLGCKTRVREDHLVNGKCPRCGGSEFTEPQKFQLMFKTQAGSTETGKMDVWLRPETCQGIFVDFKAVQTVSRQKVPFGIAQIGKSFRNEVTTKSFIFRSREFEQMEMEFFVHPDKADEWYEHWREARWNFYIDAMGIKKENLKLEPHKPENLAHYAKAAVDIEYNFPMGWQEIEGIHNRTDFDLKQHQEHSGKSLIYHNQETGEKYIPWVIETSAGVERSVLTAMCDAYDEDEIGGEKRTILKFNSNIAPVKVAVFPLQKKGGLEEIAMPLYRTLMEKWFCQYDEAGNIGRRYRRQDEIGTPYCVTIDFDTIEDKAVTIRERDTTEQVRIGLDKVKDWLVERLK